MAWHKWHTRIPVISTGAIGQQNTACALANLDWNLLVHWLTTPRRRARGHGKRTLGSAAHGSVSVHRYLAAARAGLWLRARMGLTDTYGRIPVSGCNPPTLAMKRVIFMAGGGGVCADRRAFAVSE